MQRGTNQLSQNCRVCTWIRIAVNKWFITHMYIYIYIHVCIYTYNYIWGNYSMVIAHLPTGTRPQITLSMLLMGVYKWACSRDPDEHAQMGYSLFPWLPDGYIWKWGTPKCDGLWSCLPDSNNFGASAIWDRSKFILFIIYIYTNVIYVYMLYIYIYPKNIQTNTNIVGITYIHIPFLSPYERPQPRLAVARWIHLGESAGAAGRPWWRSSPINNQWVIYLGKL